MALVCLCRGNFYWPPHTTILFCSIFLDKIVLDTLKSRYHRSAPLGMPNYYNKTYQMQQAYNWIMNGGIEYPERQYMGSYVGTFCLK